MRLITGSVQKNCMSAIEPVQWTFRSTLADSADACRAAEAWAVVARLETNVTHNLVLVIEELFTNTVKYGYESSDGGPVRVSLSYNDRMVALTYADQAQPFDSSAIPQDWEPDIGTGRIGGLGLRLIQTIGRDVTYRRDDGWNILTLSISALSNIPHG